ncbi:MAG: adenylate/guanylate cyclase domain-containing protein, partial [Rhodospirillales bacterium]
VFLFFAVTLVKTILAREVGAPARHLKHPFRTGSRTKPQAKHEEKTTKEDESSPAAVTRNLLQSSVDQGIKLKPDDYLGNILDKIKPLPADAAKHKTFMLSFLEQSLQEVKTGPEGMDSFNKFGVNLYLAGACESLKKSFKLDLRPSLQILDECVQVMGFTISQARTFAEKYEEYLMADVRYMRMFQAGGNAMAAVASGDERALKNMAPALEDWNARKAQEEKKGPITVMFTDMVGSTALTQTRGDAVAQQVVHAHNNIVRDSLTLFNGKEVKHTGDGIMAAFSNTSNGVEAGAHIQMKVAAHNQDNPDLPLHIKIGINAGEPIAEDDDLFGTTVQLTARIVGKARSEQIFVSETVHGICAGKEFRFANRGPHALKGFKEKVTLYELIWDENAAAVDTAPEKPAAAEEATEKADETEGRAEKPAAENEAEQPAETEEAAEKAGETEDRAENGAEQPAAPAPAITDAPAGDSATSSQAAVPEQDGKTDISPTGSPAAAVAAPQQAATETPAGPARQSKVDKQAAATQPAEGPRVSAAKPAQPAAAGKEGKTP